MSTMNLIPILSTDQGRIAVCDNCCSIWSHPQTGYCFDCNTDAWSQVNIPQKEWAAAPEAAAENALLSKTKRAKIFRQFKKTRGRKTIVYLD